MVKLARCYFVGLLAVLALSTPFLAVPTVYAKTVPRSIIVLSPAVKKSVTSICHAKGTRYYSQTKNFTPYATLRDCLKSGGRMPKR